MSDTSPVTYLAELDALDAERATFVSSNPSDGTQNGTLTIRRSDWELQGRPGSIAVSFSEARR